MYFKNLIFTVSNEAILIFFVLIDLKKLNDLISKGVEKNSIFFLSQ